MTIRLNGALSRCLAGSALGGLIAFSFVPAAMAQWLPPPWRAAFPGDIERSLEARGYILTAPLMRRPGIYLADVSAGPAGYRRLIIDARSGQILESFPASGRTWGPALAARDEEFGEPPAQGVGGPPPGGSYSDSPGGSRTGEICQRRFGERAYSSGYQPVRAGGGAADYEAQNKGRFDRA